MEVLQLCQKKIGNDVEVLDVFMITKIGMTALLRTENDPILEGDILVSPDRQSKWLILGEPFAFIYPFSASLKESIKRNRG